MHTRIFFSLWIYLFFFQFLRRQSSLPKPALPEKPKNLHLRVTASSASTPQREPANPRDGALLPSPLKSHTNEPAPSVTPATVAPPAASGTSWKNIGSDGLPLPPPPPPPPQSSKKPIPKPRRNPRRNKSVDLDNCPPPG